MLKQTEIMNEQWNFNAIDKAKLLKADEYEQFKAKIAKSSDPY